MLSGVLLAACVQAPTSTPTIVRAPSLRPSPTFLPFLPTDIPGSSIGFSNPTSAGLIAEGEPSQSPGTFPAAPTLAVFPMQFLALDETLLQVQFFGAPVKPAPSVILLHDQGQTSSVWVNQAMQLQTAGYNVFVADLRGVGLDESEVDWAMTVNDIGIIHQNIDGLAGIGNGQIVMMGMGTGANVALVSCAATSTCLGVVAISPRPVLTGLDVESVLGAWQGRSLLLVSADDDAAGTTEAERLSTRLSAQWQRYNSGGRGSAILQAQAGLSPILLEWVRGRLG